MDIIGTEFEGIQEFVSEDCIIPVGTHLEIYCNPDGIYADSSEGFSLFLIVDKEMTYYQLINDSDLLESCSIKNNEVRIDIIVYGYDPYNRLEECDFESISKYL